MSKNVKFARFVFGVLVYDVFVVLWGAYVRATFSGDGCGRHWPLCNGELVPHADQTKTLVEFSHRVTSGITLALSALIFVWAWRKYPAKSAVRRGATWSLAFTVSEALLGAGLVLLRLVAHDKSIQRAVSTPLHLTNTFFMLASLTLTGLWAMGTPTLKLKDQGWLLWASVVALGSAIGVAATGALAALGDTLFHAKSLAEGLAQDISPAAPILLRLRSIHPFIALGSGVALLGFTTLAAAVRTSASVRRAARALAIAYFVQLGLGAINVTLLAPVWLQMIHLLVADVVWILLVVLTGVALSEPAPVAARVSA